MKKYGVFVLALMVVSCSQMRLQPTPSPAQSIYLPAVLRGDGDFVQIYDCDGAPASQDWLYERFGNVRWEVFEGPRLSALRSCCGDCAAAFVVHLQDEQGNPVPNAMVVFAWDGAPWLPSELYHGNYMHGVYGPTNENGDIGFGMGHGAYYFVPDGGPHFAWVGNSGDILFGIGMLGGTNHEHVDAQWTLAQDCCANPGAFQDWTFPLGVKVESVMHNGAVMYIVGGE